MELLFDDNTDLSPQDDWTNGRDDIMLCMDEDYLRNKKYDLYLASIIQCNCQYNKEKDCVEIELARIRRIAIDTFGFDYRTFDRRISAMVDVGFLIPQESDELYTVHRFAEEGHKFIHVIPNEILILLRRDVSYFGLKVYLIFRNVLNIKRRNQIKGNFLFSKKQILEECGYSNCKKNRDMLVNELDRLEDAGVIGYTRKLVYKPGKGRYHVLKWAEIRAIEEREEEVEVDEEVRSEVGDVWLKKLEQAKSILTV